MTRIRATSLADLKFQQNDNPPTRAQKLELIRLAILALTDNEGEFPPHTHPISYIVGLQDVLDSLRLTLLYRFGAFWVAAPLASETMMLHTLDADITFYGDMAGSVGDLGGSVGDDMLFTVYRNPTFTGDEITGGQVIGTFTIAAADNSFTFATIGGHSIALLEGDCIGVKAQADVEAGALGGSFTFSALYGAIEDYLALMGDQTDGDDALLLAGDQQDGLDLLILAGE